MTSFRRNGAWLLAGLTVVLLAITWGKPPTGPDALLFNTRTERVFQENWLRLNGKIQVLTFSRSNMADFEWSNNRFHRLADGSALFLLPSDLRLREVPLLVGELEYELWDVSWNRPAFATNRRLVALMEIAEAALDQRMARTWFLPRWFLKRRRQKIWDIRYRVGGFQNLFALESVPPRERLARVRVLLPETEMDPEDRRSALRYLDAVQAHPERAEDLLAVELREALPLGAFQVSLHRMARAMTCFTKADFRRFQQLGQIKADSPRKEEDYPETARPLWQVLELDRRKDELDAARKAGDASKVKVLEESALWAIQAEVHRFPWSDLGLSGETATPDEIARTKAMNCVGLSLLMHAYLQVLGIDHQAVELPLHIALAVSTAGGGDWLCDATGDAEPIALKGELPPEAPTFLRPAVLMKEYRDGLARRFSAERSLAVAVLNNNSSRYNSPSYAIHQQAWNPGYLLGYQNRYDNALRAGNLPAASEALGQIQRWDPQDSGVWVDAWALAVDQGHKQDAETAWKQLNGVTR